MFLLSIYAFNVMALKVCVQFTIGYDLQNCKRTVAKQIAESKLS